MSRLVQLTPFETVELNVFDFDPVGFNMNNYEGADNAPLASNNVIALPAPSLRTKPVISPVRVYVLSQLGESEMTILEKQLLADYRQAA